jgi:ABC-type transporter MlaC component
MRLSALFMALVVMALAPEAAMAQARAQPGIPNPFEQMFQGTPQDQAACRPDSNRFCKDAEPDQFRVLACLKENRTKISVACQNVLKRNGQWGP